jgi:hypothetical protein
LYFWIIFGPKYTRISDAFFENPAGFVEILQEILGDLSIKPFNVDKLFNYFVKFCHFCVICDLLLNHKKEVASPFN